MSSSDSPVGVILLCLHVWPPLRCLGVKVGLRRLRRWGSRGFNVGRLGGVEDFKVHCYALPSSTLTAWGLMAPVRAGLACPVEGRGSWSLLVMPPDGVLPSPTALRTSRMVLFWKEEDAGLLRPPAGAWPTLYLMHEHLSGQFKADAQVKTWMLRSLLMVYFQLFSKISLKRCTTSLSPKGSISS